MGREENMEMERSRRQHEHEKKFGKDREDWDDFHNKPKSDTRKMLEKEMKANYEASLKGLRENNYGIKDQDHESHMRFLHGHKDKGFSGADVHKAAEELRMEGKGSEDPMYENSKKNK